jgi:peptidyl-prolyl cis-trans isomerase C
MLSRALHLGLVGLLAAGAFSGCQKALPPDVLARIGQHDIRLEEFSRELDLRQRGSPAPVDPRALLEELVQRESLAQEARKSGLEKDREVQAQVRDILIAKLKERSLSPLLEQAGVSDAEVSQRYEDSRAEYVIPEKVHLAVLFLPASAGAPDVLRQRLEDATARVRQVSLSGERSFGALAVNYSEDQATRYRGGDLGWVERKRYPSRIDPAVIEAGFALKQPGDISEIVQTARGLYLVKLVDRQAASASPLETVAPAIRAALLREKRGQIEQQFASRIRAGVPAEIHPERLPSPASAPTSFSTLPPKLP